MGNDTDSSGPLDDNADLGDAEGGVNRRNRVSDAGPLDPDDPFEGRRLKREKTATAQTPPGTAQTPPRGGKDVPDEDVAKPPRGGDRR
jgi:hypothetical protein